MRQIASSIYGVVRFCHEMIFVDCVDMRRFVVVREHYKSRAKRNEQTTSNYVIYGNRLLK